MTLMNLQLAVRNPARKSGYLRMQSVGESPSLLDSSLTSLGWLQNLRVLDLVSPEVALPTFPSSPCSEDGFSWETVSSSSPEEKNSSQNVHGISLSPIRKCLLQSAEFRSAPRKYRSSSEKPPFSCTTLIYLAIRHSKSRKVTLSDIYRWIKENFKYYKAAEPSWQVFMMIFIIQACVPTPSACLHESYYFHIGRVTKADSIEIKKWAD